MHFNALSVTIAAMLTIPTVLATHEIGDLCTKKKYRETFGCSSDDCSVVKCQPLPETGGEGYYWALSSTCDGMQCQNGICNPDFPDSKCGA